MWEISSKKSAVILIHVPWGSWTCTRRLWRQCHSEPNPLSASAKAKNWQHYISSSQYWDLVSLYFWHKPELIPVLSIIRWCVAHDLCMILFDHKFKYVKFIKQNFQSIFCPAISFYLLTKSFTILVFKYKTVCCVLLFLTLILMWRSNNAFLTKLFDTWYVYIMTRYCVPFMMACELDLLWISLPY